MSELNTTDAAAQILTALDTESESADTTAAPDAETEVLQRLDAGDGKPDQDAGETAADKTAEVIEPALKAQAIEPPASWKADERERFKALPPDLQKYLAERESERDRGLSNSQRESAEAKKAAQAQLESVQVERQSYVKGLNDLVNALNTMDPVIAEGRRTDWEAEHVKDPLGAPARLIKYQNRERLLMARTAERDQLQQRSDLENYQRQDAVLREKLPDVWTDDGKRAAFQSEFGKYLQDQGFTPQESAGIKDARAMLLGRKAMLYDQLMAQQAKIAATKKLPAQGKTMRVQAADETNENARAEALKRSAMKSGRTDDITAAIMASL